MARGSDAVFTGSLAVVSLFCVGLLWFTAPRWVSWATGALDAYSALEALFTGLAFAGVVWTVLPQGQELERVRRARSDTRRS